jgi:hypothetical protein
MGEGRPLLLAIVFYPIPHRDQRRKISLAVSTISGLLGSSMHFYNIQRSFVLNVLLQYCFFNKNFDK